MNLILGKSQNCKNSEITPGTGKLHKNLDFCEKEYVGRKTGLLKFKICIPTGNCFSAKKVYLCDLIHEI